jgi:hypothetical protein
VVEMYSRRVVVAIPERTLTLRVQTKEVNGSPLWQNIFLGSTKHAWCLERAGGVRTCSVSRHRHKSSCPSRPSARSKPMRSASRDEALAGGWAHNGWHLPRLAGDGRT